MYSIVCLKDDGKEFHEEESDSKDSAGANNEQTGYKKGANYKTEFYSKGTNYKTA